MSANNLPLTAAIADDHAIIRTGFITILESKFNINEIYEASNGDELIKIVKQHSPSLILMDINMPGTHSMGILQNILMLNKNTNVIIVSMNKEELYGKAYLTQGARGYVSKESPTSELVKAISCVLSGQVYIRREMQDYYMRETSRLPDSSLSLSLLSKKEIEVLQQLATGASITSIAKTMFLSPSTVGTHKASIFSKLKVDNIIALKEFVDMSATLHR